MANQRRAGIIELKLNGEIQDAKGSFTYNLGEPRRESIPGADRMHGFKETPQPAFIEGVITDRSNLNLRALVRLENATVTLQLANGKLVSLKDAFFAGDGNVTTEEAEIEVRFEGSECKEIT